MKFRKPFFDGFIPNHPEIRTKTLTQTIEMNSKIVLVKASRGLHWKSDRVGIPIEKKDAWTISTKNIDNIRNNSKLDWRGPDVIDVIDWFILSVVFLNIMYIFENITKHHFFQGER